MQEEIADLAGLNDMSPGQTAAVMAVARAHGWEKYPIRRLGLLLWALFRYYAMRLKAEG